MEKLQYSLILRFILSWQCVFNAVTMRYYASKKHCAKISPKLHTTNIKTYNCKYPD